MTKTSSYKGHPTISLDAQSRYPFSFGLAKAKLILKHLDEIKAFVQDNDSGNEKPIYKQGRCEDAPCCGCCPDSGSEPYESMGQADY